MRLNTSILVDRIQSTAFDEVITVEFSPLIELDASNGLSLLRRDTVTTTGSGAVTNANAEHKLATGTTAGSTAALRTKERGRYQPGIIGLPGIAMRRPTAMAGDQEIRWGYFDAEDGFFFGEDSSGLFIRHRHSNTEDAKVYQADWNGDDPLDGSGSSGVTLDLAKVSIFRFPFLAYGGGPIQFEAVTTDSDGRAVRAVLHRIGGLSGESILGQWKLPVNAEADNGGSATDVQLFIGGRHFAVQGRYNPNRRRSPQTRDGASVASSTRAPIISFRKKSDRTSLAKSVKVSNASLFPDAAGYIEIFLGATLTGASAQALDNVDASETAVETDVSATAMSGGLMLLSRSIGASTNNRFEAEGIKALGQDIPEDTWVTLAFKNVDGSSSATITTATFEVEEEH